MKYILTLSILRIGNALASAPAPKQTDFLDKELMNTFVNTIDNRENFLAAKRTCNKIFSALPPLTESGNYSKYAGPYAACSAFFAAFDHRQPPAQLDAAAKSVLEETKKLYSKPQQQSA